MSATAMRRIGGATCVGLWLAARTGPADSGVSPSAVAPRSTIVTPAIAVHADGAAPAGGVATSIDPVSAPMSSVGGRTMPEMVPFDPYELLATMRPGRIADLGDMRISPGSGDLSGPLWWSLDKHLRSLEMPVRVFDMCDEADAYEAMTGESHGPGALMPAHRFRFLLEHRSGLDCAAAADENPIGGRYAIRDYLDDLSLSFFATTSEAVREGARLAEFQRALLEADRHTDSASGGYHTPSHLGGAEPYPAIEFPPADRPLDRVEVIVESVSVRDGVLRGLVRNRSRELWAYGATVTAGESSWQWPLSIQPGETAPFEIAAWTGLDDPARIEFEIAAEMSPEVDLSRAVYVYASDDPNTYEHPDHYRIPDSALDSFPAGARLWEHWYGVGKVGTWVDNPYVFGNATPYRSLADVVDYFTVTDVTVYIASMDQRQQVARIAEVPLLSLPPDAEKDEWGGHLWVEIRSFPPSFGRGYRTADEATFVYYIADRSWTHRIWVGGNRLAK